MAPAITLKKNKLGNSDLMVTEVCLGTMTFGVQNTEEEAHEQLDYAIKVRESHARGNTHSCAEPASFQKTAECLVY